MNVATINLKLFFSQTNHFSRIFNKIITFQYFSRCGNPALSLKQSNLKIPSTTCPKLLKNTGQKKSTKASLLNSQKRKQKDDEMNKSKKIRNNTTTSPAPAQLQEPVQEVPAFKQKLAMASDVMSGCLNPPQNAQNNQVPNNVKDYSPHNPPVVILTDGTNISICKGCGKNFSKEQREYPNNMVFRKKRHNRIPFPGEIHF